MLGVITTREAMKLAQEQELDLVEISPNGVPPVCRIMDFGKFRYEESIKKKQARKHAHNYALKEIKFHANVAEHDYQTKLNHARKFLEKGHRVKASVLFRGREMAHKEFARVLLDRMAENLQDIAKIEREAKMEGRIMTMFLIKK